jgi:hypothetical protein
MTAPRIGCSRYRGDASIAFRAAVKKIVSDLVTPPTRGVRRDRPIHYSRVTSIMRANEVLQSRNAKHRRGNQKHQPTDRES